MRSQLHQDITELTSVETSGLFSKLFIFLFSSGYFVVFVLLSVQFQCGFISVFLHIYYILLIYFNFGFSLSYKDGFYFSAPFQFF